MPQQLDSIGSTLRPGRPEHGFDRAEGVERLL
jgi:hypothetical protein